MDQYQKMMHQHHQPQIVITEQPKQRGMRFRYECEGRSAGSIPGASTTSDRKTWPTIQVINYTGEVLIRVSLVSKDTPPRPHPHSLVGKDCMNGICQVRVNPETQMSACFSNLGIQCVKRKEVSGALLDRKNLGIDPYNTFKDSDPQAVDIDLNIVRLCFEAFISQGNQHLALEPVLSHPIFDKKATSSSLLRICRVDRSFGSCKGGDEVYLLCDKVQKDDISICFFDVDSGWESYGEFSPTDVHRQVAIVFRTPPYKNQQIHEATKVFFQLKRSSDGETSDSKDFTYLPLHHVQPKLRRDLVRHREDINIRTNKILHDHIQRKAEAQTQEMYTREGPQLGKRLRPSYPDGPTPVMSAPSAFTDILDNFLDKFNNNMTPFPAGSPATVYPSTNSQYNVMRMHPQHSYLPANNMYSLPAPTNNRQFATSMALPQLTPSATQSIQAPPNLSDMQPLDSGIGSHQVREVPSGPSNLTQLGDSMVTQRRMGGLEEIDIPPDFNNIGIESIGSLRNVSLNVDDDLGAEMKQMSIEENISISDLVKTEPPTHGMPFPNPNPQSTLPHYTQQPTPPTFNIQAPSPGQFQTPPPSYSRPSEQVQQDRPSAIPNQLTYELEQSIPSFDLNDPQGQYSLDASQNDIEELVKNNPN